VQSDSAKERLEEALLASDEWDRMQESSSEEEEEEEEEQEEEEEEEGEEERRESDKEWPRAFIQGHTRTPSHRCVLRGACTELYFPIQHSVQCKPPISFLKQYCPVKHCTVQHAMCVLS